MLTKILLFLLSTSNLFCPDTPRDRSISPGGRSLGPETEDSSPTRLSVVQLARERRTRRRPAAHFNPDELDLEAAPDLIKTDPGDQPLDPDFAGLRRRTAREDARRIIDPGTDSSLDPLTTPSLRQAPLDLPRSDTPPSRPRRVIVEPVDDSPPAASHPEDSKRTHHTRRPRRVHLPDSGSSSSSVPLESLRDSSLDSTTPTNAPSLTVAREEVVVTTPMSPRPTPSPTLHPPRRPPRAALAPSGRPLSAAAQRAVEAREAQAAKTRLEREARVAHKRQRIEAEERRQAVAQEEVRRGDAVLRGFAQEEKERKEIEVQINTKISAACKTESILEDEFKKVYKERRYFDALRESYGNPLTWLDARITQNHHTKPFVIVLPETTKVDHKLSEKLHFNLSDTNKIPMIKADDCRDVDGPPAPAISGYKLKPGHVTLSSKYFQYCPYCNDRVPSIIFNGWVWIKEGSCRGFYKPKYPADFLEQSPTVKKIIEQKHSVDIGSL